MIHLEYNFFPFQGLKENADRKMKGGIAFSPKCIFANEKIRKWKEILCKNLKNFYHEEC